MISNVLGMLALRFRFTQSLPIFFRGTPTIKFAAFKYLKFFYYNKGNCSKAVCTWKNWSSWSATCGSASRSRSIETTMTKVAQYSCKDIPTSCEQQPEVEDRKTKCKFFFWITVPGGFEASLIFCFEIKELDSRLVHASLEQGVSEKPGICLSWNRSCDFWKHMIFSTCLHFPPIWINDTILQHPMTD